MELRDIEAKIDQANKEKAVQLVRLDGLITQKDKLQADLTAKGIDVSDLSKASELLESRIKDLNKELGKLEEGLKKLEEKTDEDESINN